MRKYIWLLIPASILGAILWYIDVSWSRFMYDTGGYNCTPKTCLNGAIHNYNFNSGVGSIYIPFMLQVLSAIVLLWWHQQCHVSGCYWPRLPHKTEAGDYACWRHHPESRLSVERLHIRHHAAKAGNDAN